MPTIRVSDKKVIRIDRKSILLVGTMTPYGNVYKI
ncbi:MAG: hypothetical protein JWR38_4270 [Mucilaginibacter sp.]|nr:hypothetical protein [Mucilaginibacter sp.]